MAEQRRLASEGAVSHGLGCNEPTGLAGGAEALVGSNMKNGPSVTVETGLAYEVIGFIDTLLEFFPRLESVRDDGGLGAESFQPVPVALQLCVHQLLQLAVELCDGGLLVGGVGNDLHELRLRSQHLFHQFAFDRHGLDAVPLGDEGVCNVVNSGEA